MSRTRANPIVPTRTRAVPILPPPPEVFPFTLDDVLQVLTNVLEYSAGQDYDISILRMCCPQYLKAIGKSKHGVQRVRTAEFYFPIRIEGNFVRILSVLQRDDKGGRVEWDCEGYPIGAARLLDDCRVGSGVKVRQENKEAPRMKCGFALADIQPFFEVPRI